MGLQPPPAQTGTLPLRLLRRVAAQRRAAQPAGTVLALIESRFRDLWFKKRKKSSREFLIRRY